MLSIGRYSALFSFIVVFLVGCSEASAPEDPRRITFVLSDSTVLWSTFSFLSSGPRDSCFAVAYSLDRGRMTGPLTNRASGGVSGTGDGNSVGVMSWIVAGDGAPSESCPGEFSARLTVGNLEFDLRGLVGRPIRLETAASGPAAASGTWFRSAPDTSGPFLFYDYDMLGP